MILMIDNRDSFVWNLVRYLRILHEDVRVVRCDEIKPEELKLPDYEGIVLSPGPGRPEDAGALTGLVSICAEKIPLFGVCLGQQAIASVYGARIICGPRPMHGKVTPVIHDGKGIFRDLPSPLDVTRYHSLVVDPATLPPEFTITSRAEDGSIMGIRHSSGLLEGVQFHPEAELTSHGLAMVANFLRICREAGERNEDPA